MKVLGEIAPWILKLGTRFSFKNSCMSRPFTHGQRVSDTWTPACPVPSRMASLRYMDSCMPRSLHGWPKSHQYMDSCMPRSLHAWPKSLRYMESCMLRSLHTWPKSPNTWTAACPIPSPMASLRYIQTAARPGPFMHDHSLIDRQLHIPPLHV
jgi:hypothetical protein